MNKKTDKYQVGDIVSYKKKLDRQNYGEIGIIVFVNKFTSYKYLIYSFPLKGEYGWDDQEIRLYKPKTNSKVS